MPSRTFTQAIQPPISTRSANVRVQSLDDLPGAVNGVIQLADDTRYEFNGLVVGSATLRYGSGTMLAGVHLGKDGYIYTGAGTAIEATNVSFFMSYFVVVASAGTCFALSADNVTEMYCEWCAFYGAALGAITGYRVPTLKNINCEGYGNGIIFGGVSEKILVSTSPFRGALAASVALAFGPTMNTGIVDITGNYAKDFAADAVFLSLDPAATIRSYALFRGNALDAVATPLEGVSPATEGWGFVGNAGLRDSEIVGEVTMQDNATATVLTQNIWTKVAGTTVAGILERMTMPQSNRLTLGNAQPALLSVAVALSLTGSQNGQAVEVVLYKNEVAVLTAPIGAVLTGPASARADNIAVQTVTMMEPGDYIEVWCRCTSGNDNITVGSLQFTARG